MSRSENIDKMNDALESSLLKLLQTQPFDKISLSQLVNDAGYSRGAFYNHYEDIYDFMNAMISRKINKFYENKSIFSSESDIEQITQYTRAFADYIEQNREFFNAVAKDETLKTQYLSLYSASVEKRRKTIPKHSLPKDIPSKYIPAFQTFWHAGILATNRELMLSESLDNSENIMGALKYIAKKVFTV